MFRVHSKGDAILHLQCKHPSGVIVGFCFSCLLLEVEACGGIHHIMCHRGGIVKEEQQQRRGTGLYTYLYKINNQWLRDLWR